MCGTRYNEEKCQTLSDHFWCPLEKRCLPVTVRCNHIPECLDGADEIDCDFENCSGFSCANSQCIDTSQRCDDDYNCVDGHKKCDSGQCIPMSFWCDYVNDCPDRSDENNCQSHHRKCRTDEYECDNGQCISHKYQCFLSVDPRNGCADRSNLKNCSQWQCSDDQIKCADSYCVDGQ
ncbi:unnamed protein product, partial [Oppiella nova]